ncbi:hypothetical protein [Roseibium algae]|uniref:Papain-like cysteine peptidase DUF1796 n=1 Tax=Roseibium algae TaxID=3123038 RepID=A0ABU8THF6_9HYPH
MSCQSARQIRSSVDVLGAALGEDIAPERHFFDGLIAPISGLAQLFEDGFPMFSREDIVEGPGHPTWQPYGIRFLHHFREEGSEADIDTHFAEDFSRFSHMREKFDKLSQRSRVVFVISNSQNNLDEVAADTGIDTLNFEKDELVRLQRAVDLWLGRGCEYLIVSHPERHGDTRLPELVILEADDSEWTGDKAQWRTLFDAYLAQKGPMPFSI